MRALVALIDLVMILVFIAVIASWLRLAPDNPVRRFLRLTIEPILEPLRRVIPPMGGLDFSPLVLIFGLQLLKRMLLSS